ncbi:MAG TPA: 50S ribosomal protein L6 [Alphaproteobacteria bacterium]|jgi:large subunit ribosomal protein L6
MSRVGKNPVVVPAGVEVKIDGTSVRAKGSKGEQVATFTDDVALELADGKLTVKPTNDSKQARMMWGTARNTIRNMVQGVSEGFKRELEINGVGYRANVEGRTLVLQLGYSHDVRYPMPQGIDIKVEQQRTILVSGADKRLVGQVAAEIRSFRPPEPYKGKGIKYKDETILRKEGKKK